ncbi:stalk domain-containing protein [Gorillibacterium sp. sgz500922]|uniref:stalk domain-containing protein n=1 Tax=Gorillibacterium sp. sgz500922 TaxID=3446694 RepID=UPI003F665072
MTLSPSPRSRRILCVLIAILLVPLFLGSQPVKADQAVFYTWPSIPSGTIGVARPDIEMRMSFSGLTLSSYTMTLNGSKVAATYDRKTETFHYTPSADLTVGSHKVSLQVAFKGYAMKTYQWSFTVAKDAAKALGDSTGQAEALQAVNALRKQAGLSAVALNAKLNQAAAAHAGYQAANGLLTHQETKGLKGFTGASLSDRLSYYGYSAYQASEDIRMQSGSTPAQAVMDLYDAPYHRIPFLDPALKEIGYGRSGAYQVLLFGAAEGPAEPAVVASPVGSAVKAEWDGHETPDPLRLHGGAAYPLGYPLMAGVYGKDVMQVLPVEGSLKTAAGQTVSLLVNGADQDDHLAREVLYLPAKPLKPNTEYRARVVMKAVLKNGSTRTFTKEWTFRTASASGTAAGSGGQTFTSGGSSPIRFRLGESSYSVGGTAYAMSAKPILIGSSAYLPLRDLGRALAADVAWNEMTQTASYSRKGQTVSIPIGSSTCRVNGKAVTVTTPARLVGGRTLVPVRLVASLLGLAVDYRQQDQSITVTP